MKPDFSVEEAVAKRCSVRTYDPRPVEPETRQKLLDFAGTLRNPFGPGIRLQLIEKTPETRGEKLGTYGILKGAGLYLAVTAMQEEYAAEALGYEFEQVVLYAASLGLGTCWLGGTFNRSAFASKIELREKEVFPILSPLGYPAQKKCFSEEVFRRTLKADGRKPWEELFFQNGFEDPLTKEAAGEYQFPLEMLRQAPSAVNRQPWRVVAVKDGFHFFRKTSLGGGGSAMDMQRIDMGIGICHFHLAAQERNLTGRFEKNRPAIRLPQDMAYVVSWAFA